MKQISIFLLSIALALITTWPASSLAQKTRKRRPATTAPTPVPDMRPEAIQVAAQINNFSKFVYIYGKIANGLEIAEDQAKQGATTPQIQAKNKESKDALVANINGLRAGLDTVVKSFQANPRLQVQYLKISYAADAAANAEQLAKAGRYDEAGKVLVTVIERLSDTLISMRLL